MTKHDNLRLWTRFADIDPQHTKPITGKAYKGTSPKPQYIVQLLTEMFGPVGQGFGWNVVAEGFTPLGDEVLHWCRIRFWWAEKEAAALEANIFEAYGQTKALMKTKNGLMMDEDAPKKSLTDAITKAASQIGIASNLFMGRWDDSRYVEAVNEEYRKAEREEAKAAAAPAIDADAVKGWLLKKLGSAADVKALDAVQGDARWKQGLDKLSAAAPDLAKEVVAEAARKRFALGTGEPVILGEHRVDTPAAFHG